MSALAETAAAPWPLGLEELDAPVGRLAALLDAGSLRVLAGDADELGALAVEGTVEGSPVVCYSQDRRRSAGALGSDDCQTILAALGAAERARVPVVALLESAGARIEEGPPALAGYASIFRATVGLRRRVPQLAVVTGVCAGGGAYAAALADVVLMAEGSRMFLTGPRVLKVATGEESDPDALGGPLVHERNGVAQLHCDSLPAAFAATRELLGLLPRAVGVAAPRAASLPPEAGDPAEALPAEPRRPYDVKRVAARLFDDGRLFELDRRWAANLVVALARLEGEVVGVIANQPAHLGGLLDAAASEKACRFIELCDRFRMPLVTLVDTPGFLPGQRPEREGVIRYGAGLLDSYASATVPRVSVVLRKAFGGGYIAMDSRGLGADRALAWRGAEIGVMGSVEAAAIKRSPTSAEPAPALAAGTGYLDSIIDPGQTRALLVETLLRRGRC